MSLKEKLQQDWKIAMKNRDKFRSSTLSMAKAAILQVEKTDNRVLDDEEIIGILSKEVKSRRDALVDFENGNRQDLVDEAKSEIEILLEYLPKQLTEDEIAEIVRDRKSTRLNSSHANISYAVFCLKKKNKHKE